MSLISLAKYSAGPAQPRRPRVMLESAGKAAPFAALEAAPEKSIEEQKQEYAAKVAAHIPSEAVGFYIFGAGLFQSASAQSGLSASDGRTVVFYITLALSVILAWYLVGKKLVEEKASHPYRPGREHLWKMFAAALAFVVWAAAMPGSVFAGFGWYDPRLAAVLLALVALILPKLSDAVLRKMN